MMQLDVKFEELNRTLDVNFGEIQVVDNYDVGFTEGFKQGKTEGYSEGYSKGETAGMAYGYDVGKVDGKTEGIETGKQEMVNTFWDGITNDGKRTAYYQTFKWMKFTNEMFRPTYTIRLVGNNNSTFGSTHMASGEQPIDLQVLEEELGYPIIDTTGATYLSEMFGQSQAFVSVGVIDATMCTAASATAQMLYQPSFYTVRIKNIKKIIVSANTNLDNMMNYATGLEHCIFEGTIGKTGLNTSTCTLLDKESHESIINCLSTETSGLSVTVSKTAVNKAFETSSGANNGSTSAEWTTLVTSRNNWTINLA